MARIPSIEELEGSVIVKETGRKTGDVDVTIVTVCFNPLKAGRREVFRKNLDSVQAQEGVRLEHLIVDGASTDGTQEWLMDYGNLNHEIRILSKPDSGIYEAMNRGIALARGRYILYLNSDDYFHDPRGMAASLARIEALGCDFSFAPVRFTDPSVRHNPQRDPQRRLYRFLISWCFSHQTMLTSRALLQRIDGFDTTYRSSADYDQLLRMIAAGAKGCFVPLTFTTFSMGGFSVENPELSVAECIVCLRNFFRNFYSVEMSHEEAEYIFLNRVFPSKYLDLYRSLQRLIRERFIGIPAGPVSWVTRWFNYIKYYLKCRNTNI